MNTRSRKRTTSNQAPQVYDTPPSNARKKKKAATSAENAIEPDVPLMPLPSSPLLTRSTRSVSSLGTPNIFNAPPPLVLDPYAVSRRSTRSKTKPTKQESPSTPHSEVVDGEDEDLVSVGQPGLRGLRNLGHTCFMNVVLQACSSSAQFRSFFLDWMKMHAPLRLGRFTLRKHSSQICLDVVEGVIALDTLLSPPSRPTTPGKRDSVITDKDRSAGLMLSAKLHHLLRVFWTHAPGLEGTDIHAVRPREFVSAIWEHVSDRFAGFNQQDAAEFFDFLLANLQDELSLTASPTNFITTTMEGTLETTIQCGRCLSVTATQEPFLNLRLQFPREIMAQFEHYRPKRGRQRSNSDTVEGVEEQDPSCSLNHCLRATFSDEHLADEDSMYYCNKCRGKQQAVRRCRLVHLPDVLVMTVNRIVLLPGNQRPTKITAHVEFPIAELRLQDADVLSLKAEQDTRPFSLRAAIVHDGFNTHQGHYRCLARPIDHRWYEFDDEKVTLKSQGDVLRESVYVLVYER